MINVENGRVINRDARIGALELKLFILENRVLWRMIQGLIRQGVNRRKERIVQFTFTLGALFLKRILATKVVGAKLNCIIGWLPRSEGFKIGYTSI